MSGIEPAPILRAEGLAPLLKNLRASGKRVVFTNGVFDLVHPGHIRYLRSARELGDLLVVALNSDASVIRLKGPSRPLLPFDQRAKIIASLEMVDYVTIFDEDTPLEVIRKLRPDVLVKGGDYEVANIVGRSDVEAGGGEVRPLQLEEGFSTSNIIERVVRSVQKTANS